MIKEIERALKEGRLVETAEQGIKALQDGTEDAEDVIRRVDFLMILMRRMGTLSAQDYKKLNDDYQEIREVYEQIGIAPFQFPMGALV